MIIYWKISYKYKFAHVILPNTFIQTDTKFFSEGVRSMFISTFFFALANVFVKQVSHLPTMEIVFFRCALGVLFCYAGLRNANADWRGSNRKLLLLRGLFGTTALYFFFLTVQNVPLASAMTIQYLSPIFTTIIAIFLLKESVRWFQWFCYALAFVGVIFIEQFDARITFVFLILGVTSAFCSGVAYNLVRTLRGREHPLTVVFHFQIVGLVVGLAFTIFNWQTPSGWDWLYLLFIGAFSQIGQIFLTNALQKEKAASVAIVNYTGLLYGLLIGWLAFGETQTAASLAGMILVVFGVVLSVIFSKRRRDIESIEATAG
ncbi:MAG: DMT family transporter [Pyrinomonadaceae bacterium]|nr:DMT family transporter [Pyrinomonadaceae bacterium]